LLSPRACNKLDDRLRFTQCEEIYLGCRASLVLVYSKGINIRFLSWKTLYREYDNKRQEIREGGTRYKELEAWLDCFLLRAIKRVCENMRRWLISVVDWGCAVDLEFIIDYTNPSKHRDHNNLAFYFSRLLWYNQRETKSHCVKE